MSIFHKSVGDMEMLITVITLYDITISNMIQFSSLSTQKDNIIVIN